MLAYVNEQVWILIVKHMYYLFSKFQVNWNRIVSIWLVLVAARGRLMRCLFAVHLGPNSVCVWLWPQAIFALFKDSACSGQIWLLLKYHDAFTLFYLMAVAKDQNLPSVSLKYALITICQKRKIIIIILKLCYMIVITIPLSSRFKSFIYVCGCEF